MKRLVWQICLAMALVSMLGCPTDRSFEISPSKVSGAAQFAGELIRKHPYLFDSETRAALDRINRQLREVQAEEKRAKDSEEKQKVVVKQSATIREFFNILESHPHVIRVTIADGKIASDLRGPVTVPGDAGALLFRIEVGQGEIQCINMVYNLSEEAGFKETNAFHPEDFIPITIDDIAPGTTWALVNLRRVPLNQKTTLYVKFELAGDPSFWLPVDVITPEPANLKITVLSAETLQPTPAMVRLVWKVDGSFRKPSNAVDFEPQLDDGRQIRHDSAQHYSRNSPSHFETDNVLWCIPGPFDMTVPPGELEIVISRGLEHIVIHDTFTLKPGERVEKTYQPRRWVEMAKLGWYSGDDHVHCRIVSDADAQRLMTWARAEDLNVTNVLQMGDIYRTYFQQRGFGEEYRFLKGTYALCPGQECPRTHYELGHTIALNTQSLVRNEEKYYLYDWVFDTVHAQGGLCGYAHVQIDDFFVHRDMSINIPKSKVDFVEILQEGQLGTELYYDFLNTGFKLTASAGSDVPWAGSIGEVRVYTYVGSDSFSPDAWFEAFRKGRTFVTNGPMIDLRVEEAMPGDEIVVNSNRKLRVQARTWGDPERLVPTRLEIVRHGKVIRNVASPDARKNELALDFEVQADHGFWIAARAAGSDGTWAHTTPVYVIREGLRFWKFDAVEELIAKRLNHLKEVEQLVGNRRQLHDEGKVPGSSREIQQMVLQGPALLRSVDAARKIYENLKQTAAKEQAQRRLHD